MNEHEKTREYLIEEIKKEIIGPEPLGEKIDLSLIVNDDFKNPFSNIDGQEVLIHERPTQKYGAGVIFPKQQYKNENQEFEDLENFPTLSDGENTIDEKLNKKCKEIKNSNKSSSELSDIEFDLSGSNTLKPSSMGVSFYATVEENDKIEISHIDNEPCGFYKEIFFERDSKKRNRSLWVRNNYSFKKKFSGVEINSVENNVILATEENELFVDQCPLKISIKLIVRRYKKNNFLFTACLVNDTPQGKKQDAICLFQSSIQIKIFNKDGSLKNFLPYPKGELGYIFNTDDKEKDNLDLIYQNNQTYSIGHGCASDWELNKFKKAEVITGNHFPIFDSPNFTPDFLKSGSIEMKTLAGLDKKEDWENKLLNIVKEYEDWINLKNNEFKNLEENLLSAAKINIKKCEECKNRILDGINFLKENDLALQAFKWSNEAILSQQLRSNTKRDLIYNSETKLYEYDSKYIPVDLTDFQSTHKGNWRPFQIAFILSTLRSSVIQDDNKRENVELIFFPTGGGKTEAYLGLSAFVCFYNRLINKSDDGVQVLMRYTLRLLTAQQFTRAASLICSMELIRKNNSENLGKKEFSIGVWLGSANTPNDRETALNNFRELSRSSKNTKNDYPFLLTKCPCCSSVMGQIESDKKYNQRNSLNFVGLDKIDNTVRFKCHDIDCEFHLEPLPIYIIDEDVYEHQPSIVIGTVDKFAQITWQPNAKKIFGLNEKGDRSKKPPSLILQDELHLITGPLGSMCGMYEALVEDLCTDKRNGKNFKPKIVCSTATIRSYERQINDLYNRNKVSLFPPFGLDISDNFFAKYAMEGEELLKPKKYLGVCTPNFSSTQTAQVRIYSRILYSIGKIPSKRLQDPWYTLMNFFGSLRELATTITLIQVDIPDRLRLLQKRYFDDYKTIRKINEILELTSRLENSDIPKAIDQLSITTEENKSKNRPIDMCLTSNIIEVGIDIDRLSLITILGQPKTTSSYIQVSGRIGRNWKERPGLVVTMYGSKRPRDKSHFEKFKSYHQKLYAEVEPMSVTPFAPPVIERALHAVMVGYVRMYSDSSIDNPNPFPEIRINEFENLIIQRIKNIDPDEIEYFETIISKRKKQWLRWQSVDYDGKSQDTGVGLIYPAGKYLKEEFRNITWLTPNSLRNVDYECLAKITPHYVEI